MNATLLFVYSSVLKNRLKHQGVAKISLLRHPPFAILF